ncbi:MAG TPA: DNA alkylation repair protein [Bacteroidales bacterium]|nr:MAG: hypothetical protein A2X11_12015 [Bacteroidetes bacterium GWE2_42_24]OFY31061.1 MAG: hypothetical protein A2X09_15970 [Bacteroidetes bacterium GWF2_43_11]HAQ64654.1 DNA alkylation repair protein [Bacteroidales bacterium]HBZ66566.1 DNA alkylation repair protein [Bacteroidales bacterium]
MNNQAQQLVSELEALFQTKANPSKAPAMEAYLRNQFRSFGINSPDRCEIIRSLRPAFKKQPPAIAAQFALICWEHPMREMQYAGMDLYSAFAENPDANIIATCETLITHKSWWDTVDYIAPNIVGNWLKKYPADIRPVTDRWMDSGHLWLQRSCLLFQLKHKDKLDFELLRSFITRLNTHPDFFIRKAIGWSLRSYARQNPEGVKQFVASTALSNLSRREALKHLADN